MTIIEMAREMGKLIQESEEYKALADARTASDNDETLQEQIQHFNLIRMKMDIESSKPEPDEEKLKNLNEELMTVYTEVMGSEKMVAFNVAKEAIDSLMNNVTTLLSAVVNGADPATFDPEQAGCSGSCSTCGGCG